MADEESVYTAPSLGRRTRTSTRSGEAGACFWTTMMFVALAAVLCTLGVVSAIQWYQHRTYTIAKRNYAKSTTDARANDIKVLNYALTAEHFEAALYKYGNAAFNASWTTTNSVYNASSTKALFLDIGRNEAAHVTLLAAVIEQYGGEAVPPCVYNFTALNTLTKYGDAAIVVEDVGVSAYAGANNAISDDTLSQVAATILSYEARHAAVLRKIAGLSPFVVPADNADKAQTPYDVVQILLGTGFIVSCPAEIDLPLPRASLPINQAAAAAAIAA